MDANACKALELELNKLTRERNTLTYTEFLEFEELFKSDWKDRISYDEYHELCLLWKERVSLYHNVIVIADEYTSNGDRRVLFTLPPLFTEVASINEGNTKSDLIINIFDNALTKMQNNPLYTDINGALQLMSTAIDASTGSRIKRIEKEAENYANIMRDLKPMLNPTTTHNKEIVNTNDMDWE